MPDDMMQMLAQFGVAGLMGALWIWERRTSRQREMELTEAHAHLMRQREPLRLLMRLVRRNTQAIERFDQTQKQLCALLDKAHHDKQQNAV